MKLMRYRSPFRQRLDPMLGSTIESQCSPRQTRCATRTGVRTARCILWLLICLITLPWFTGCSGCREDEPTPEEIKKRLEEEKKKKAERDKEPLEIKRLSTLPNDLERIETAFKPGHWTSCSIQAIANHDDFSGEMVTEPFELPGLPFRLGTSRPAILPKRQPRYLETVIFIPPGKQGQKVAVSLRPRNSYQELALGTFPTQRMPEYQFFFFVVAQDPLRYQSLKEMPTFQLGPDRGYRLLLPRIENRTPLPEGSLTWTSIAYLLWDDVNPEVVLSEAQQQAMLDWIHWGGRLIISGPGSYDVLRGSFLKPYLPVESAEVGEITEADLGRLNANWTVGKTRSLSVVEPWSALNLQPRSHPDTRVLASCNDGRPLVVERSVGSGSVLITAFRLGQRELLNWPSFDGFFNGCIAGRDPRRFRLQEFEMGWEWKDGRSHKLAERMSQIRYFTRDTRLRPDVLRSIADQFLAHRSQLLPQSQLSRTHRGADG